MKTQWEWNRYHCSEGFDWWWNSSDVDRLENVYWFTVVKKKTYLWQDRQVNCFPSLSSNSRPSGKGFDRHLFAMKQIALANDTPVDLFDSQPYQHINHIVLSTSTLSSPAVLLGGFAPVVPDGFGVGYRVDNEFIGSQVTAYDGQRDPAGFASALESSLKDIHAVFDAEWCSRMYSRWVCSSLILAILKTQCPARLAPVQHPWNNTSTRSVLSL